MNGSARLSSTSLTVKVKDENDAAEQALSEPSPIFTVGSNKLPSPSGGEHVTSPVFKSLGELPPNQPQSNQSSRVSGSKFPEVNSQVSSDCRKRDIAERRHDLKLTSLEAAENGQSLYAREDRVECSCERTESSSTTSTNSEAKISRNEEELSTMTDTSNAPDDREKAQGKGNESLRSGEGTTVSGKEESDDITEAWKAFEKSWQALVNVTEEEEQNGYRFSREIDPRYLGFHPRKRDKREYLKAYPIIAPLSDGQFFCTCSLPMTIGQWGLVVAFFVFFAAMGTGVFFYFRAVNS